MTKTEFYYKEAIKDKAAFAYRCGLSLPALSQIMRNKRGASRSAMFRILAECKRTTKRGEKVFLCAEDFEPVKKA